MNLKKWVKYRVARRLIEGQPVATPINEPVNTLLVICFDAIGDFVLSLPALDALRRRYPDARMELLCSPRNLVLAGQVDGVVACHPVTLNDRLFDRAGWDTLRELKARRFDAVINLFDEPDELAMARMLYVANGRLLSLPLRRKSDNQQELLPLFRQQAREVAAATNPHFVYRMLAIAGGEEGPPANIPCPCNPDYDTSRFGRYVVVNLAGSQSGNTISRERQAAILAALPMRQDVRYLCFSPDPLAAERPDLVALYPDSILDAASLVRDAAVVVSTDTSIVHIAASHKVPTLILMNGESWRDAFIPLHGPHRVLRVPGNNLDALKPGEVAAALGDMLVS